MTTFSFAHIADLHLDTPFSGLASLNDDLAARLKNASLDAWDRVVQGCLDHGVDFVVIAGDVYDSDTASVRAQLRFKRGLARLSDAGIPVMVVHGNHDPNGGRYSAIERWPEQVTVFGTREVTHVEIRRGGDLLAVVSGISFPERHVQENLARRFARSEHSAYHVAVLHTNVDGDTAHGVYAPCTLQDLVDSRYDYWALGHIHARRVLRDHAPAVVYPGNTQARHPNETGPKGFALVQVRDGTAQVNWVETDSWRFGVVGCDITELTSLDQVEEQVSAAAARLASERPMVLRAQLTGGGVLHRDLHRAGTVTSLLDALRDRASTDLWWDDVQVQTRPAFDRQQRLQGEDFIADLLNQAERADAHAAVGELVETLRGHPALGGLADELGLDALLADAPALLREAEVLALGLLEGETR
ncbi:metallophosphoesterase family protein [Deinococcus budaensis]|uniref:Putative phosphodiesterase n=1 Tax=Deinococcus budaensis TaxID=1665626 RepID=A0A7W8GI41_9DEIO|nr:DNA repair exonuclease [Deinococcus budaensis]MBB5235576.1 putative phosphodiesterase [Deinococcus budaensis]